MDEKLQKTIKEKVMEYCQKYAEVSNELKEDPLNQKLLEKEESLRGEITFYTMMLNGWALDINTDTWVFRDR